MTPERLRATGRCRVRTAREDAKSEDAETEDAQTEDAETDAKLRWALDPGGGSDEEAVDAWGEWLKDEDQAPP